MQRPPEGFVVSMISTFPDEIINMILIHLDAPMLWVTNKTLYKDKDSIIARFVRIKFPIISTKYLKCFNHPTFCRYMFSVFNSKKVDMHVYKTTVPSDILDLIREEKLGFKNVDMSDEKMIMARTDVSVLTRFDERTNTWMSKDTGFKYQTICDEVFVDNGILLGILYSRTLSSSTPGLMLISQTLTTKQLTTAKASDSTVTELRAFYGPFQKLRYPMIFARDKVYICAMIGYVRRSTAYLGMKLIQIRKDPSETSFLPVPEELNEWDSRDYSVFYVRIGKGVIVAKVPRLPNIEKTVRFFFFRFDDCGKYISFSADNHLSTTHYDGLYALDDFLLLYSSTARAASVYLRRNFYGENARIDYHRHVELPSCLLSGHVLSITNTGSILRIIKSSKEMYSCCLVFPPSPLEQSIDVNNSIFGIKRERLKIRFHYKPGMTVIIFILCDDVVMLILMPKTYDGHKNLISLMRTGDYISGRAVSVDLGTCPNLSSVPQEQPCFNMTLRSRKNIDTLPRNITFPVRTIFSYVWGRHKSMPTLLQREPLLISPKYRICSPHVRPPAPQWTCVSEELHVYELVASKSE